MTDARPNSMHRLDNAIRRMAAGDKTGNVDWLKTRQACEWLFAYRKKQAWPPTIVIGTNWEALYVAQRGSLDVVESAADAVEWANALIARVASFE